MLYCGNIVLLKYGIVELWYYWIMVLWQHNIIELWCNCIMVTLNCSIIVMGLLLLLFCLVHLTLYFTKSSKWTKLTRCIYVYFIRSSDNFVENKLTKNNNFLFFCRKFAKIFFKLLERLTLFKIIDKMFRRNWQFCVYLVQKLSIYQSE